MAEVQGLRINKAIAGAGICSRRHADDLIRQGRVRVNGRPVLELGLLLQAGDSLEVDGRMVRFVAPGVSPHHGGHSAAGQSMTSGAETNAATGINRSANPDAGPDTQTIARTGAQTDIRAVAQTPFGPHLYLMLNKPVQVVSTARDPEGRPTVLDFLPEALRGRRLFPVGRLDYFSEGLILLTDDGALTQRLTHPRYHLPKYYEVLVRGQVPEGALEAMRRGMTLAEGERLAPVEIERLAPEERGRIAQSGRPEREEKSARSGSFSGVADNVGRGGPAAAKNETLRLTLHQGVNRQIRRMCRDLGLTILRLRRVGQGPLRLGELPTGKSRPLNDGELAALFKAVGL